MADRTPPAQRSDYVDFYPIQTRWMDNDTYGHVNNAVHYSLFDTAVNGWLIDRGLLDPRHSETFGLVVETGCRYHSEFSFPDRVTAGLRVARLGTSSIRYEVALFRNEEPQAAAEGFFVHVYVNRATRRPVPIEEDRRAAFESLMKDVA